MSNKTSDIDVGNIEEDINELKILLFQDRLTNYGKRKLIDYYENKIARQKQINEEHKRINGELRERVKELEEENTILKKASNIAKEVNIEDVTDVINKSCKEFMSNYIPKQVIIDKIKENIEILNKTNDGNLRERLYLENGIMKELLGGERNELER